MNREDFILLNSDIIYFDNAATTLKPYILSDTISDYYNNYSANKSRGSYDLAKKTDKIYENVRQQVSEFIKAKNSNQIVFTNNTTDSMNKIVFGYFKNKLKSEDEVLITTSEHASNILPWLELGKELNLKIKFIPLNSNFELEVESVLNSITDKTKVISIAHITNVIGDVRDIKSICKIAREKNIKVIIDGAQSVPHKQIDISDIGAHFLVFSAHKMLGPTGVGVLYVDEELIDEINPIIFGGGMNNSFNYNGDVIYNEMPTKLEAGTPNIAGVIGFGSVLNYINKIGINKIEKYELELKKYAIMKLEKLDNIIIYNKNSEGAIVTFNIKGYKSYEVADYLNRNNICIRSGSHCAKILKSDIGESNTCRASFYFYNTKEEIDRFVDVLSKLKDPIT